MEKEDERINQTLNKLEAAAKLSLNIHDAVEYLMDLLNGRVVDDAEVAERCIKVLCNVVTLKSLHADVASSASDGLLRTVSRDDTGDAHVTSLITRVLSHRFSPLVGAAIFQRFVCAAREEDLRIDDPLNVPQREPLQISDVTERHLDLTAQALVKGMNPDFLLSPCTEGRPLLFDLLRVVVKLCSDLNVSRYQALYALAAWLDAVERLLKDNFRISDEPKFVHGSREADAILSIVSANWETPVKGVPDLAKKCYASVLRLHVLERGANPVEASGDLHRVLLGETMCMPWTCKPKLCSLACLLQHVGLEECTVLDPDLPRKVIDSFSSTHLVSAAADVYKASLPLKDGQVVDGPWAKHWLGAIVEAISNGSGVQHQNLTTHLLPWTLRHVSNSFAAISVALQEKRLTDSTFLLTLFRVAKQVGSLSSAAESYELIDRFIHHARADVRAEALGILCSCHAKSRVPSDGAMQRIREFLPENLNIDNAWFRTELTVHVENLVIRLRDCALTEFSRSNKRRGKREVKTSDAFAKIVGFVEWLVSLCVQNLFPGAGYQRLITCVTILEAVFGTFSEDPKGKRKMTQRREEMEFMLNHVKAAYRKLDPTHPRTQLALMQTLFHGAEDVREVAFQVLVSRDATRARLNSDAKLLTVAKKYMSSPKAHDTAVGATLARLYFRRWKGDEVNVLNGMAAIYDICRKECGAVRTDLVEAAQSSPAHGAILALATCLSDDVIRKDLKKMGQLDFYLKYSLDLANNLICDVLNAMAAKDTNTEDASRLRSTYWRTGIGTAPSFEDTTRAFLQLIGRKWDGDTPPSETDARVALLLEKMCACSWLCIKNSCKLFEELTRAWSENSIVLTKEDIQGMDRRFIDVLVNCRHRGAIESCYESYRFFCHLVAQAADLDIAAILITTLRLVFTGMALNQQLTSVTRRSAGRPLLVRAIVENCADGWRHFLGYAVPELERAARSPLPETTAEVDQEVDVVQAEALHILCNLVGAASLSTGMLPHLGRILHLAIDMLGAPRWVIVNAAHQLYGAVLPRILGQKKTRDAGGHNTLTAADLFSLYPNLYDRFLACLTSDSLYGSKDTVFVLDFLSRLTPATSMTEDQETLLKPFLQSLDKGLSCDSWSQRLLVAKCYSLLCVPRPCELDRLLLLLDDDSERNSNNHTQGVLRLSNLLLRGNPALAADLAKDHEERLTSYLDRLMVKGCYPNCQEYLALLECILPEKDRRWRQPFRDRCSEDVGRKADQTMPGSSRWKVSQTAWLLRALHGGNPADTLRIVDAAEDDDDVLEGVVAYMSEQVENGGSQFPLRVWQQIAGKLVDFCNKDRMCRTLKLKVLELLVQLCQKEGFLEVYLLHRCFRMAKEHATKERPGGTSVTGLSLLLWSTCTKSILSEQLARGSRKVFRELEQWTATVSSLSKSTADEVLRLNTARSFGAMGRLLLKWVAEYVPFPTTVVYSLFNSLLSLLQDESSEVRTTAAAVFVATGAGQDVPVQPNVAIKELFKWLMSVCTGHAHLAKFFADQLRSEVRTEVEIMQLSRSGGSLFEQEDANVYAEPLVVLALFRDHVREAIAAVGDEQKEEMQTYFVSRGKEVLKEAKSTCALLGTMKKDPSSIDAYPFGQSRVHLALSTLHVSICTCLCALEADRKASVHVRQVVSGLEFHRKSLLSLWTPWLP